MGELVFMVLVQRVGVDTDAATKDICRFMDSVADTNGGAVEDETNQSEEHFDSPVVLWWVIGQMGWLRYRRGFPHGLRPLYHNPTEKSNYNIILSSLLFRVYRGT